MDNFNLPDNIPTVIYVICGVVIYSLIVFYKVQGIAKKLLLILVQKIEDKANSANPQVAGMFTALKKEVEATTEANGLDTDMDLVVSKVDTKDTPKRSKWQKFLNVMGTIVKVAVLLK